MTRHRLGIGVGVEDLFATGAEHRFVAQEQLQLAACIGHGHEVILQIWPVTDARLQSIDLFTARMEHRAPLRIYCGRVERDFAVLVEFERSIAVDLWLSDLHALIAVVAHRLACHALRWGRDDQLDGHRADDAQRVDRDPVIREVHRKLTVSETEDLRTLVDDHSDRVAGLEIVVGNGHGRCCIACHGEGRRRVGGAEGDADSSGVDHIKDLLAAIVDVGLAAEVEEIAAITISHDRAALVIDLLTTEIAQNVPAAGDHRVTSGMEHRFAAEIHTRITCDVEQLRSREEIID